MDDFSTPLISVIVPVYQIDAYLPQCIDSILCQSFRDFELILVDDGSHDRCPGICDEYATNDNRVRVIHKKNGGLSDARNAGIKVSCGKYLLFIDGDDFIVNHSFIQIRDALFRDDFPDILFLCSQLYYNDEQILPNGYPFEREDFYNKDKEAVLNFLSSGLQFHVSACLKTVKRELIIKNHIFFMKGIIGEDVDYSINLYLNANTYSYLNDSYYYYRQDRIGSIMAQKNEKRFMDLLFIIQKWTLLADGNYVEYKKWIFHFLFHQYYVLVFLYNSIHKKIKTRETITLTKHFSYLLKFTVNKKVSLLYMFYKIFGLTLTSYILNLLENNQHSLGLFRRSRIND